MRILRIRLRNYRGVADSEIVLPPTGVTVVEGDNEVGKSSLAEALDLLFDYPDSSTNKAVKVVKPVHRDAGTEVEAEIEAGPYRFTYRKRFHRERETVLVVTAPRPENHVGREAHHRALAILDEAVDLPLWKALRLQQGVRPDQADLSEQTSLAAALDAASEGARAGERETSLTEAARAEFERYWTAGRKALRGEVAALAAAEDEARRRVEDLRRRLADLDDDVDHAAHLVRAIEGFDDEIAGQREVVEDYERKWRSVESLLAAVEKASLASKLAEADLAAAQAASARRQQLVDDLAAAERRQAERAAEHRRHEPALAAAQEALAGAEEEAGKAAEAVRLGEKLVRQRHDEFQRLRDIHDLQTLAERWERVQEAEPRLAELEVLLDGNGADDEALARIEQAHVGVVEARARTEGERAVVDVAALADVSVSVDGGQATPLPKGDSQVVAVAGATAIELEGVARLVVRAGREAGQSAAALADAEERLASALAAAGAADLADARSLAAARRDAQREREHLIDRLQADLRDLTPDRMAQKIERLRQRVGDGPDTGRPVDFDAARRMVEEAEALAEAAQDAQREWDGEVKRLGRALQEARNLAARSEAEAAMAAQQAAALREQLEAARAERGDGALAKSLADAEEQARTARRALADAESAAEKARPDDLKHSFDNAAAVLGKMEAEQRLAKDKLIEVRQRLALLGEEGLHDRLAAAEADLEHRARERRATERRAAAARRLYETLERCRGEARRAYVSPLKAKIEAFGRIVFGDDFSVDVGEDLRIRSRTLAGITVAFDQLSTGTREQLCVISRLACAALVAADGGVPVVLDDALGWSDARRLERLGAVLSLAAQDSQVLVLTCLPERYRHVGAAHTVRLGRQPAA